MEGALVRGALAEEGDRDAPLAKQLAREPGADRERDARPDDGVGTEHAARGIRDVHRSALPAAQARLLGEQLGHHAVDVSPLGEAVAVAAVRGRDVVAIRQRRAHANRHGLLAERGVDEARDLAVAVELGDPRLERADQRHPGVELQQPAGVGPQQPPVAPQRHSSTHCSLSFSV